MSPDDDFRVAVSDSAVERNEAVAALVAEEGARRRYETAADARDAAAALTAAGGSDVRIQAVAPQDPADVDAYLVGASRADAPVPDGDPADGWSFAVDAAQYGALGEALLTAGDGLATPLDRYLRRELDASLEADLDATVDADPDPVSAPGVAGQWVPDCRASVALPDGRGALFLVEVKTGDGGLERSQRAVAEAAEAPALLARVDVSDLPREYEVAFERIGEGVGPSAASAPGGDPAQRTIDEWD